MLFIRQQRIRLISFIVVRFLWQLDWLFLLWRLLRLNLFFLYIWLYFDLLCKRVEINNTIIIFQLGLHLLLFLWFWCSFILNWISLLVSQILRKILVKGLFNSLWLLLHLSVQFYGSLIFQGVAIRWLNVSGFFLVHLIMEFRQKKFYFFRIPVRSVQFDNFALNKLFSCNLTWDLFFGICVVLLCH